MSETLHDGILDSLAEGIWSRLRDVLLAQVRWERFVSDPENARSEAMTEPAASREDTERATGELVLRALGVGVDPVNHAILAHLAGKDAVGIATLATLAGLPRIALSERLSDLVQAGLASYAAESRQARATSAGEALVALVDEVRQRLTRIVGERWAETVS